MRGKSVALLVLALGCGLVASLGITQLMARRAGDQSVALSETQPVYVAVKEISLGSNLSGEMVKLEDWPKDRVPAGALARAEDVEGRRTKTKFYVGEPILDQKLFGRGVGEQGADSLIPKGYRVVSVRVDAVTIHGGLLMPGSRVDIQLHVQRNPAMGIPEATTKTILQDIKVFAVNDVVSLDSANQETKSIQGRTVSLLVTPEQGEKVTAASEMGTIRLAMRGPDDEVLAETRGTRLQDVFGASEGSNRDRETLAPETSPTKDKDKDNGKSFVDYLNSVRAKMAAAESNTHPSASGKEADRWTVRVLKGTEVNEIEFEDKGQQAKGVDGGWRRIGGGSPSGAKSDGDARDAGKSQPSSDDSRAGKPGESAVAKDGIKDGAKPRSDASRAEKDDKAEPPAGTSSARGNNKS
jgi:pilus assembly protein CpaB